MALSQRQALLLQLNSLLCSRPGKLLELLDRFGPEGLYRASPEALVSAVDLDGRAAGRLLREAPRFDVDAEARRAARVGASFLFIGEPGYPQLLAAVEDAPLALYVRGSLSPDAAVIAVVGSRFPSAYGRRMAARLAADAAAAGYCVASGMARGIDAEAHQAALRAEGTTWAVLGCGVERAYPPENARLLDNIVSGGGAVLSEFPMGTSPIDHHFPRRNRIVSGLSWATVVVEGRMRSGSLSTARCALDQGRELLAVPGPADSPLTEAPHHLISRGARLATRLSDILDALPPGARRPSLSGTAIMRKEEPGKDESAASLSLEHRKILQSIGSDSLTLDELGQSTGLDFTRLSTIIFELELQNLVTALPGQRYAKKGN